MGENFSFVLETTNVFIRFFTSSFKVSTILFLFKSEVFSYTLFYHRRFQQLNLPGWTFCKLALLNSQAILKLGGFK